MSEKELRIWIIIIVAILAVALVITMIVLIKNDRFQKTFAQGKFRLSANVYEDPEKKEKNVEFVLANQTINPISVTSVGLIHNDKRIEMIDLLCEDLNVSQEDLFCKARNQLKIVYPYENCFDYFKSDNNKILFFVMDNMGNETKVNAKNIRKNIKNDQKALIKQAKAAKKGIQPIVEEEESDASPEFLYAKENKEESASDLSFDDLFNNDEDGSSEKEE